MKTQNHYGNSIKNLKKKKSVKLHLNFKLFIHVFSFEETLLTQTIFPFPETICLNSKNRALFSHPFHLSQGSSLFNKAKV